MKYVVDASVCLKWLIPEVHWEEAGRLRAPTVASLAPEHLLPELGNALRSKHRRGEIGVEEANDLCQVVLDLPVELTPGRGLLAPALQLAIRYDRSVYDSLYITLALAEECQFVTADRRLYNALAPVFSGTMLWVEDIPVF